MRRLLIFAYDYPPSLIGVRRTVKFIRYLRDYGWRCAVITVKPVCGPGWDDAPLREVAPARPIVQATGSLDPYRSCMKLRGLTWPLMRRVYHGPAAGGSGMAVKAGSGGLATAAMRFLRRAVFIPDDRVGWLPFAVGAGWIAARHWKPDALYSTSYPHTAHLAAAIVHALTKIPWVADFRDGWTQNPAFFDPLTPFHAAIHRALERSVARRADRIITVSPPITAHLQSLRPGSRTPAETIYNGFDDLNLIPSGEVEPTAPQRQFEILYGGTFFGTRRPDTMFRALAYLAARRPDFHRLARLTLFTSLEPRWIDLIRDLEIAPMIDLYGFVSHKDIIDRQHRADALALVVDTGPGSEIIVTQKVFEYLAAGRPIWAIAGPGACRDLLTETGGAVLAPPDNAEEAAHSLEILFDAWRSGESLAVDPARVAQFHRRAQSQRLAQILDDMIRPQHQI